MQEVLCLSGQCTYDFDQSWCSMGAVCEACNVRGRFVFHKAFPSRAGEVSARVACKAACPRCHPAKQACRAVAAVAFQERHALPVLTGYEHPPKARLFLVLGDGFRLLQIFPHSRPLKITRVSPFPAAEQRKALVNGFVGALVEPGSLPQELRGIPGLSRMAFTLGVVKGGTVTSAGDMAELREEAERASSPCLPAAVKAAADQAFQNGPSQHGKIPIFV